MIRLPFSLTPFPGEDAPPGLRIAGTVGRTGDALSLDCALLGNLSALAIPFPPALPERRDRLWEYTCLELFLAEQGADCYREFHLSPARHWNVFRFTRYREERREENAFASLPFQVRRRREELRFSLDLDCGRILTSGRTIEAAVCAVLRNATGGTSRWALTHSGDRPDFHRRDGFLLNLATG